MENQEFNYQRNYKEGSIELSEAFPVLMRKVYVWMALALLITGMTACSSCFVCLFPAVFGCLSNCIIYGRF